MKVFITGAGGQVGTALVSQAPAGLDLVSLDRGQLDITDRQRVHKTLTEARPDVIINAAAYTAVDRAEAEPDRAREVNERGPRNIAEGAAQIGARLIHLSTDFVFDGETSQPYAPDAATRLRGRRVLRPMPASSTWSRLMSRVTVSWYRWTQNA